MPDAGWRLVTLTVGGVADVADVLAGPQPYALTYCTYHKKDNNIISLMSGSGCRDSCSSSSSCPSSCSFSTAWSCSRGCERALLLLFYALLCFFPSQWVAFPRGVAGMKRGFAAGCALSFSAVKLCVSNVLCLTPPANHLSSTPPRIRHWFTHRVWWAEEGGGAKFKTSKRKRKWAARDARWGAQEEVEDSSCSLLLYHKLDSFVRVCA